MSIVIRTNCNGTLGHLARCRHLGHSLALLGYQVHYLLDSPPDFDAPWLRELPWSALYENGSSFTTEQADASACKSWLAEKKPSLVIVDDYRLLETWENAMQSLGCRILAIDDVRRSHHAHMLLEPKTIREADNRQHHESCVLLQGSRYTLLDPAYANYQQQEHSNEFNIVFSLGGGGDLQFIHDCIQHVLKNPSLPSTLPGNTRLALQPVIGPMAINAHLIHELAAQYPDTVFPVEQANNLAPYLAQANLFVGAASTSVYETAACNVPAITFSMAENQFNNVFDLELLGHYIHINNVQENASQTLGKLIATTISVYPRLKRLRTNSVAKIDGMGASRVARIVHECLQGNAINKETELPNGRNLMGADSDGQQQSEPFFVRACDDTDINRYLAARNLPANRSNMTSDNLIHPLHHYNWWFTTDRRSYRVEHNGKVVLYIWHEQVHSNEQQVLVGGWFVASDNFDLMCVVSALQWQLKLTDKECPEVPWIAIIKKTNQFVLKMNERAGFCIAPKDSDLYNAIQAYFPDADPDEFHYVYRVSPALENTSAEPARAQS